MLLRVLATQIFYSCQNNTLLAIDVIYSIGFIVWDTIFISFVLLCLSLALASFHPSHNHRSVKFPIIFCQLLHHLFIYIHSFCTFSRAWNCIQLFPILDGMFRRYLGEPQVENFNWWITCCCLQFSFNSKRNQRQREQQQRQQKKSL